MILINEYSRIYIIILFFHILLQKVEKTKIIVISFDQTFTILRILRNTDFFFFFLLNFFDFYFFSKFTSF